MIKVEAKDWNKFVTELQTLGDKLEGLEMEITFKSEADYGAYPEFGTSRMSPRPYFRDNFNNGATEIQAALQSPDPTPDKIVSAGERILQNMKNSAPVLTGHLRDNITMDVKSTGGGPRAGSGPRASSGPKGAGSKGGQVIGTRISKKTGKMYNVYTSKGPRRSRIGGSRKF